jgi:hypothetical protein
MGATFHWFCQLSIWYYRKLLWKNSDVIWSYFDQNCQGNTEKIEKFSRTMEEPKTSTKLWPHKILKNNQKDQGYGWIIVLLAFCCHTCVWGLMWTVGIWTSTIQEVFGESVTYTSLLGSGINGVNYAGGKLMFWLRYFTQSFSDPAISSDSDLDWSPKFGLGLGLKKSWLSYTLTQNYKSMKYLRRFNYSRYLCMWFIKGIIGF